MIINTDKQYENEVYDELCLFYPPSLDKEIIFNLDYKIENNIDTFFISIKEHNDTNSYVFRYEENELFNFKKNLKRASYMALSNYTKKSLPWGCLTGIRPTKIAYDLMHLGLNKTQVLGVLTKDYYVSKEKASLIMEIILNQQPLLINDNLVDFYVNIPFCTTRCAYCSFISAEICKVKPMVEPYVDALIEEIKQAKKIIAEKCLLVKSVYIGGGTPTSLSPQQLDRILKELNFSGIEFTVECGRPDTITHEHLKVLKQNGVTRISVNPQTFNDKILEQIGRNHTSLDTVQKYEMAKEYGFDINMDLIAGLEKETQKSFQNSVLKAISLNPENITIHTLALKRASSYGMEKKNIFTSKTADKMVDFARKELLKAGYVPYYLYRQKNMVGNLENCGYTKPTKQCKFNIDSMEEITSVIACGANAISKRIFVDTKRVERQANVKDIKTYLERYTEMIQKKKELFN